MKINKSKFVISVADKSKILIDYFLESKSKIQEFRFNLKNPNQNF